MTPRQAVLTLQRLARALFGAKPSLEKPEEREFAQTDPRRFLARFTEGAILDEVQRCATLLSWLQQLGDKRLPEALDTLLRKGGYPALYDRTLAPNDWFPNYVATYLERDVRQLLAVHDLSQFHRFVRMCAARSGQLLNLAALGADCGISAVTAGKWLSVLETSYLVMRLPPYHRNFGKRLVKTPKLYFLDVGRSKSNPAAPSPPTGPRPHANGPGSPTRPPRRQGPAPDHPSAFTLYLIAAPAYDPGAGSRIYINLPAPAMPAEPAARRLLIPMDSSLIAPV